ncbi:MAG: hypothetical protein HZC10_06625, partial [Nitrospirae bacterium]|nr:hypothetical protein [Nitrospirota bacterium]
NVPLQSGQNIITVTATDGDGKTGTDALVVNLTSSGGSGSGSGGDSGGGSGGGGCGFVKNDGKGLKANGDMVAFAMMLIIMPTIFYLIKRGGMMRRFLP